MPRLPRIDLEGVLHHVMVRGIVKRDIFLDDRDRSSCPYSASILINGAATLISCKRQRGLASMEPVPLIRSEGEKKKERRRQQQQQAS
jgi:hypothetical protein